MPAIAVDALFVKYLFLLKLLSQELLWKLQLEDIIVHSNVVITRLNAMSMCLKWHNNYYAPRSEYYTKASDAPINFDLCLYRLVHNKTYNIIIIAVLLIYHSQ